MTNFWSFFNPSAASDWPETYHGIASNMDGSFDMPALQSAEAAHMRIVIKKDSNFGIYVNGTRIDESWGSFGDFNVEYCHTSDGWHRVGGAGVAACDESNAVNQTVTQIRIDTAVHLDSVEVWLWGIKQVQSNPVPAAQITQLFLNDVEVPLPGSGQIAKADALSSGNTFQVHVTETKGVGGKFRAALYRGDAGTPLKASESVEIGASGSDWLTISANLPSRGNYNVGLEAWYQDPNGNADVKKGLWVGLDAVGLALDVTVVKTCPPGKIPCPDGSCKVSCPCPENQTRCSDGSCMDECPPAQHYVCDKTRGCFALPGAGTNECDPAVLGSCSKCDGFMLGTTCVPMPMLLMGIALVGVMVVVGGRGGKK